MPRTFHEGRLTLGRDDPGVSGLAVCRRLLEANKGGMDILTEKGMGTTIALTFPLS